MVDGIMQKNRDVWDSFAKTRKRLHLMMPDESLVRIFKGPYVQVPQPPGRLLDHGFGSGNSLLFFHEMGYDCYGCEVVESLNQIASEKFQNIGAEIPLSIIEGTRLNYEDDYFDIVVSWNSIHYNGRKQEVQEVLDEIHRILKPGGVLIISTLHPDNSVLQRGEDDGTGTYVLKEESRFDNRKGLTFYCARDEHEFHSLFRKYSDVKYGHFAFDFFCPEYKHVARLAYAKKGETP